MAQKDSELKFMQTKSTVLIEKPKPAKVKSLETTSGIYRDVELVTEVPDHLKAWNHENYVGLKFADGSIMWQNIAFIMSMTFDEGKQ